MRHSWIFGLTVCLGGAGLPLAAHAGPAANTPAARLSAALGGSLDDDLGDAGALAHAIDYRAIVIRPGRSIEYRRRIAREIALTAQVPRASGAAGDR